MDMVKVSSLATALKGVSDSVEGDVDALMEDGWDDITSPWA
jgi:hypothetical protein